MPTERATVARGYVRAANSIAFVLITVLFCAVSDAVWGQGTTLDLGTFGESSVAVAVNAVGQIAGENGFGGDAGRRAFFWTAQGGMIDVGTVNGFTSSYSVGLNARGDVVGNSYTTWGSIMRPFVWTSSRGMIDLGTLGGNSAEARAINDRGQVVGSSYIADGPFPHAFLWTAQGGMIDLGHLGNNFSQANAVNASGQVVGFSETAQPEGHAFSWTAAGGMIDLGTLGGRYSQAFAVNDRGQVVGESITADGDIRHAFSWTAAGGMVDLGVLGGPFTQSYAVAVNGSGEVVGNSYAADGIGSRGFRWTAARGMIDLGTFGGNTYVSALNASGQVVGTSALQDSSQGNASHAFVWSRADGMIDLGALSGGNFSGATAINAHGQVVGASFTSGDTQHATLWQVSRKALPAIEDGYVRDGRSAASNFGSAAELVVKRGIASGNTRRTFITFDTTGVKDVDRATLRVYGRVSSDASADVSFSVCEVLDASWREATLTWNHQPGIGKVVGSAIVRGSAPQWIEVDVTSLVRTANLKGSHQVSVALVSPTHTSASATLASSESGSRGPQLLIIRVTRP